MRQYQNKTNELLTMNKKALRITGSVLTSHVELSLCRILLCTRADEQKKCEKEEEDNIHILCRRLALARKRYEYIYLGQIFLEYFSEI